MAAGYSGTPLIQKLGIQPGSRLLLIHPPDDYMQLLEKDVSDQLCSKNQLPDMVHLFAEKRIDFEKQLLGLTATATRNPAITVWVSWFKQSSRIPTDLTENHIRNFALQQGWVDVKVCAVSAVWSGLKLVVPKAKRNKVAT